MTYRFESWTRDPVARSFVRNSIADTSLHQTPVAEGSLHVRARDEFLLGFIGTFVKMVGEGSEG